MAPYVANLVVLAILLVIAAYSQHQQRKTTKISLLPPNLQKDDRPETIDDGPHDLGRRDTTTDRFFSFRNQFLQVYVLAMAADWLQVRSTRNLPRFWTSSNSSPQGSFMYSLYKNTHQLPESVIAALFTTGFVSGGVSATFVGYLADRFGRKLGCLAYCAVYSMSCLTVLSSNMSLLFLGRVLGGVSTTLLFTVFETWMITEYHRLGFGHSDSALSSLYSTMSILNGFVAVACGVIAQFLVQSSGSEMAPFLASVACLIVASALIRRSWVHLPGNGNGVLDFADFTSRSRIMARSSRPQPLPQKPASPPSQV
jgi:MFS family permease